MAVGDVPFHLKFALKVTHPPLKNAEYGNVVSCRCGKWHSSACTQLEKARRLRIIQSVHLTGKSTTYKMQLKNNVLQYLSRCSCVQHRLGMYRISGRFLLTGAGSDQNVEWSPIFYLLGKYWRWKIYFLLATKPCYSIQSATEQQHKWNYWNLLVNYCWISNYTITQRFC